MLTPNMVDAAGVPMASNDSINDNASKRFIVTRSDKIFPHVGFSCLLAASSNTVRI